ncbi:DUF6491 family protein [Brevundimonas sp.]|uniref:DUF6491 family protein n=1 Tax=Brevundimonas sp. TaxID=1871086 RepID=UPI0028A83685|nr:DUF6491 family protein [Brevundimonas sp.]
MLRLTPSLALIATGAVALTGCAPTASTEQAASTSDSAARQCLFQDQISSFRVRNNTIYLRGSGKDVFQLEAAGYCRDLENAMGLAFLPQGGLTRLCTGDWTMIVPSGGTPPVTPCRVRIVKRLTDAEVAALPDRDRP